tara:strand:+ start:521 stop:628 length:108 start_codon:yes stop_codon:yes gene_type:complete
MLGIFLSEVKETPKAATKPNILTLPFSLSPAIFSF